MRLQDENRLIAETTDYHLSWLNIFNWEAESIKAKYTKQKRIWEVPLNTILQIKSMLIAKAIADTPKKKPDGEYLWDAFEPAVTYTAQSS